MRAMTLAPPAGERRAQHHGLSIPRRIALGRVPEAGAERALRPPRELAEAAASLSEQGAEVELVDLRLGDPSPKRLLASNPEAIVLWGSALEPLASAARELRGAGRPLQLIAAGEGLDPDAMLAGGLFDLVVLDGAAHAVRSWYARLVAGASIAGCPGLAWRTAQGAVVREPALPPPADPDALPAPDWSRVDLDAYGGLERTPVPMLTGWSCGPRCQVCHHSFGHTFRPRSLAHVLIEVDELRARGAKVILLEDEPLNLYPDRAARLVRAIARREGGLCVRLARPLRADQITPDLAAALAEARVDRVELVLESVSPTTQRETRLNLRLEAARQGIERLAAEGIHTHGRFTLGRPGETAAEQRATVQWARCSALDGASFSGGSGRRRAWALFHVNPRRVARRLSRLLRLARISAAWRATRGSALQGPRRPAQPS